MANKITAFKNGPLEVDCKDVVFTQNGKTVEIGNLSHPCRCGKSQKKPWCDGAHVKANFSDEKEIDKEIIQTYKGENITVHFNRSTLPQTVKTTNLKSLFHL